MIMSRVLFVLLVASLFACEPEGPPGPGSRGEKIDPDWLINEGRVLDGGPGKDGIISLDEPTFVSIAEVGSYLEEDDLIFGLKLGEEIRAYPHPILDWHEIVNDSFGHQYICANYCPLTGSAFVWNRQLKFRRSTFGVSGLLYNNNLILYDRDTDSHWSQLYFWGVNGEYKGEKAELFPIVETTWGTWKELFPDSKILSEHTGHDFPYDFYPYDDYKTQENFFIFSFIPVDHRLFLKERVHAVIEGEEARVYRFESFASGLARIQDSYQEKPIVVVGSQPDNLLVSYYRELEDGTLLDFELVENQLPVILKDQAGNHWDLWGEAVSGPRTGQRLRATNSVTAYWFSIGSFYPDAEIYQE
jgi:hypothetical protein